MHLKKLVELDDATARVLGYSQGGHIELELSVRDDGDCIYYNTIRRNKTDVGDLKVVLDNIYSELNKIWSGYAKTIDFHNLMKGIDDEDLKDGDVEIRIEFKERFPKYE